MLLEINYLFVMTVTVTASAIGNIARGFGQTSGLVDNGGKILSKRSGVSKMVGGGG